MRFGKLIIQNFRSFGNIPVEIDLSVPGLTLILGENLDDDDPDEKNGCGKSSIYESLVYVLFGKGMRTSRVNSLVNRINGKGLLVSLEITDGTVEYRITRGQKPTFHKLEIKTNQSKDWENITVDSSAALTEEVTKVLKMDYDLFRCVVVNSTRVDSFLSSDSNTQKSVTESLFSFGLLGDLAKLAKANREQAETFLSEEKGKIEQALANRQQMMDLLSNEKTKENNWDTKHTISLNEINKTIEQYSHINFKEELDKLKNIEKIMYTHQTEYGFH